MATYNKQKPNSYIDRSGRIYPFLCTLCLYPHELKSVQYVRRVVLWKYFLHCSMQLCLHGGMIIQYALFGNMIVTFNCTVFVFHYLLQQSSQYSSGRMPSFYYFAHLCHEHKIQCSLNKSLRENTLCVNVHWSKYNILMRHYSTGIHATSSDNTATHVIVHMCHLYYIHTMGRIGKPRVILGIRQGVITTVSA